MATPKKQSATKPAEGNIETGPRPLPAEGAGPGIGEDRVSTSTLEEATEAGLLGNEVDGTPNENYTLKGVTSGKPTPETSRKA